MPTIRECFVSRLGPEHGILVEFDFCQLEICALAEISRDPILIMELNEGVDIHRANAAEWKGIAPDKVDSETRKQAKVMTFQLQYGASAPKMASTLGISPGEAHDFIKRYYKKYSKIEEFHSSLKLTKTIAEADNTADYFTMDTATPTRRIYTFKKKEAPDGKKYYPLTELKNYMIQGFATGDIVPIVINDVLRRIHPAAKVYFINTVHDSFMFDCNFGNFNTLLSIVEDSFTNFPTLFKELFDYDLKVEYNYDVKYGKDWQNMEKLTRKEVQMLLETEEK